MFGKNVVTLKAANIRMKVITVLDSAILLKLREKLNTRQFCEYFNGEETEDDS